MQELENCMFSLRVHCDEQTYLVSSDRPFVVVLGKQPMKLHYMSAMHGGGYIGGCICDYLTCASNVHKADQFQVMVGF